MAEKMVYTLSSSITLEEFVDYPKCCVINRIGVHAESLDVLRDIEEILSKRQWHAKIIYAKLTYLWCYSYFVIYIHDEQNHIKYIKSKYLRDHDYDEAKTFYSLLSESYENYLKKKTPSECAESIINKCGGDKKYTIPFNFRISLVPYCEDKEYIDSLMAKFNNIPRNTQMIDRLAIVLHEKGWYAEIYYDKCNTPNLKRLVIDKFYIKVYDNCFNMKFMFTQDFCCDVSDSIDLLLRKCYEKLSTKVYTSTATGYVDYNKISLCKEYLNEVYGKPKEEENMLPKSVKEAFDPFYYNPSDFCTEPAQVYKDMERHEEICAMEMLLGIQNVKFQDPATIVFWDDGTKTVVKCQKGDKYDPEKGLAMAIIKKKIGKNNGYFNKIFEKWCPDEETEETKTSERPKVFTETAEEYAEEVKKQKKIGDGYDDIRWEKNGRIVRK